MPTSDKILVARIVGVHGIKGYVKLKCFTERPESVLKYKPLCDETGREFILTRHGDSDAVDRMVVSIKGVSDRNAAEALRGTDLFVKRETLGLKEDELLMSDLVGFDVIDSSGTNIGTALRIENFGGGDTLEVELLGGNQKTALLLLNSDGLVEIRPPRREIVINRDFLVV